VVVNHGEEPLVGVSLSVALRTAGAARGSPALGRFTVKIAGLKAGGSQEVQAPLEALGTLASMPPWRQIRAEIE